MAGADAKSRRGQKLAEWRIDGQLWIENLIEALNNEIDSFRGVQAVQQEGLDEREAWWEENQHLFTREPLEILSAIRDVVEGRFARTRELVTRRIADTENELVRAQEVLAVYHAHTPTFTGESAGYLGGSDVHGAERYARQQDARIEPTGRCPACAVPVGEATRWCDDHDLIDRWIALQRDFEAAWPAPLFRSNRRASS